MGFLSFLGSLNHSVFVLVFFSTLKIGNYCGVILPSSPTTQFIPQYVQDWLEWCCHIKLIVLSWFTVTNKKKGLMQLKLSEPVKKEVSDLHSCLKIGYFFDILPPINFVYTSFFICSFSSCASSCIICATLSWDTELNLLLPSPTDLFPNVKT